MPVKSKAKHTLESNCLTGDSLLIWIHLRGLHCSGHCIRESFPKGKCSIRQSTACPLLHYRAHQAQVMNTPQCVSSKKQTDFLWGWHHHSHRRWTLAFFHLQLEQTKLEDHWQLQAVQSTPQGSELKDSSGPVCSDSSLVHGHALCHLTPCYF